MSETLTLQRPLYRKQFDAIATVASSYGLTAEYDENEDKPAQFSLYGALPSQGGVRLIGSLIMSLDDAKEACVTLSRVIRLMDTGWDISTY